MLPVDLDRTNGNAGRDAKVKAAAGYSRKSCDRKVSIQSGPIVLSVGLSCTAHQHMSECAHGVVHPASEPRTESERRSLPINVRSQARGRIRRCLGPAVIVQLTRKPEPLIDVAGQRSSEAVCTLRTREQGRSSISNMRIRISARSLKALSEARSGENQYYRKGHYQVSCHQKRSSVTQIVTTL